MARIIGIDYGTKRIGIAVTDPLQMFATALDTVAACKAIDFLVLYSEKEQIERFVIGYPLNLNNIPAKSAQHVEAFVKQLQKKMPAVPVTLVDERFTSKLAFRAMIDCGVKKMDRRNKGIIDKVSAAIILQWYLDSRKIQVID